MKNVLASHKHNYKFIGKWSNLLSHIGVHKTPYCGWRKLATGSTEQFSMLSTSNHCITSLFGKEAKMGD